MKFCQKMSTKSTLKFINCCVSTACLEDKIKDRSEYMKMLINKKWNIMTTKNKETESAHLNDNEAIND